MASNNRAVEPYPQLEVEELPTANTNPLL